MVEGYNVLEGTQTDINRRLLRRIEALENGNSGDDSRLTALETAVGDAEGGLVKDVADIQDAIGDADTKDTILYRLAELEKG